MPSENKILRTLENFWNLTNLQIQYAYFCVPVLGEGASKVFSET